MREDQKKKNQRNFIITGALFLAFILYTIAVKVVDVQAVGPENSNIGFATINRAVFIFFGDNPFWYNVTEVTGILALLVAAAFGLLGVAQLVTKKSITKVDTDIIILGGFYVLVMIFYVLFEVFIINYRPVILEEGLEASYPSSHSMLVFCIMITAIMQFRSRISEKRVLLIAEIVSIVIISVTVLGRLVSGVHWFTDILGGVLLGTALVMLYYSAVECMKYMRKK
ncbi:MAG: phosphatase PAP2 family protein [Lachnospiraceae bacterium]|nr:phosphatase PAP2 family protein [Lachnospiraceae bacterium]